MPELPDLHVFAENITARFAGKKLTELKTYPRKRPIKGLAEVKAAVEGAKLADVTREGKELRFEFDNSQVFHLHLMRVGKFQQYEQDAKHAVSDFKFSQGDGLTLIDFMGGCVFKLNPKPDPVPDALANDFTLDYFRKKLEKKSGSMIKPFLIDQKNIRGIGNAYADEILWQARIAPQSKNGSLPANVVEKLYECIGWVLNDAIKQIKQIEPDILGGEIRSFMKVHGSKIEKSPTGAPVLKDTVGGQGTYYTEEQRVYE